MGYLPQFAVNYLTDWARILIAESDRLRQFHVEDEISSMHLLDALAMTRGVAQKALQRLNIDLGAARSVDDQLSSAESDAPFRFGVDGIGVIAASIAAAWDLSCNYVGTEHILLGLVSSDTEAGRFLAALDVEYAPARVAVCDIIQPKT